MQDFYTKTEGGAQEEKSEASTTAKAKQTFQSKVPREVVQVKKDKVPPPGTYDVGYYDLSKKIIKDVNNENRPPFNMASSRFKKPKIEERSNEEEETGRSPRSRSVPVERKQKMNAVFVSQTKKNYDALPVSNNILGPGQYTNGTVGSWVKRTYNITFMQE